MKSKEKLGIYKDKKVFVTGHTGFKGSWLTEWLLLLGANVHGYSLPPPTEPALFSQLNNSSKINDITGDVNDFESLKYCLNEVKPDIIFHLAAQSLVRESYKEPLNTLQTNIMGTANLLDAVRQLNLSTSIIVITSDKCYDNKEWIFGYRENDPMGGHDPYSASKGAAEIIVSSYRNSFFDPKKYDYHGVKLSSARAGNVIGGGDWANDRIIPDCIRALQNNQKISVRNPLATRPWQHVLESLGGYLLLGSKLLDNSNENLEFMCSAFNFGPLIQSNRNVESLVKEVLKNWQGEWNQNKEDAVHEAYLLNLNIDKASQVLNWSPVWNFESTILKTIEWYKSNFKSPGSISEITKSQIQEYSNSFDRTIS